MVYLMCYLLGLVTLPALAAIFFVCLGQSGKPPDNFGFVAGD